MTGATQAVRRDSDSPSRLLPLRRRSPLRAASAAAPAGPALFAEGDQRIGTTGWSAAAIHERARSPYRAASLSAPTATTAVVPAVGVMTPAGVGADKSEHQAASTNPVAPTLQSLMSGIPRAPGPISVGTRTSYGSNNGSLRAPVPEEMENSNGVASSTATKLWQPVALSYRTDPPDMQDYAATLDSTSAGQSDNHSDLVPASCGYAMSNGVPSSSVTLPDPSSVDQSGISLQDQAREEAKRILQKYGSPQQTEFSPPAEDEVKCKAEQMDCEQLENVMDESSKQEESKEPAEEPAPKAATKEEPDGSKLAVSDRLGLAGALTVEVGEQLASAADRHVLSVITSDNNLDKIFFLKGDDLEQRGQQWLESRSLNPAFLKGLLSKMQQMISLAQNEASVDIIDLL